MPLKVFSMLLFCMEIMFCMNKWGNHIRPYALGRWGYLADYKMCLFTSVAFHGHYAWQKVCSKPGKSFLWLLERLLPCMHRFACKMGLSPVSTSGSKAFFLAGC